MINTSHLFRPLGGELIRLLEDLGPEDWLRSTSAAQWTVKDVAAHLLDGDLRRLSAQRDGHTPGPSKPLDSYADLVEFLNRLNQLWVEAARRLSYRVIIDSLRDSTERIVAVFERADPMEAATFPVAWAGEDSSRMWLDLAREFTERWHHQDQIREAVGAPPLSDPVWLRPVLEVSLLALPHAFRNVAAPSGATVQLRIGGASGGQWMLINGDGWVLERGESASPDATVASSDLVACRLLLHRLNAVDIQRLVVADGDRALIAPLLATRAVMV